MKFVVFYHYCIEEPHYDLMLETEDSLETWRIPEKKMIPLLNGEIIEVISIPLNDKKFLNFEGELGHGIGCVKIYDKGTCSNTGKGLPEIEFLIFGSSISGKILFEKKNENRFKLKFIRLINDQGINEKIC